MSNFDNDEVSQVRTWFEKFRDLDWEERGFDKVQNPLHKRPDMCAMLLLDKLCPNSSDIIQAAEHDIIYFDTSVDDLEGVATEEDILTLVRCGVIIDEYGGLASYV
jgi:hypothetical protein